MKFLALALLMLMLSVPATAHAQLNAEETNEASPPNQGHWRLMFSPYAAHYTHSTEHRPVWAVGLEKQRPDSYLYGAVFFSNSFGQESGYVFGGQRLRNFSRFEPLYVQWTAGLMYGYKHQYEDKVPLNYKGFSPGLVLMTGWQFTPRYSASLNVLGNSAVMLQFSAELQ